MFESLESLAEDIRGVAGVSGDDLVLVTVLIGAVMGPGAIILNERLRGQAYLRPNPARIIINPRTPDFRFVAMHELSHWLLRTIAGFTGSAREEERYANYLAAAMLAPRELLHRAHTDAAGDVRKIARRFGLSQTAAALRVAEVQGGELAVVTRSGNVMVRTNGAFPWESTPVLEIARDRATHNGLVKTRLRGGIDAGRIVLQAK